MLKNLQKPMVFIDFLSFSSYLGPSWSQVGTTWGQLEQTWTNLGPTCANLTSRRYLVSSLWAKLANLGPKITPRWGSQRGPRTNFLDVMLALGAQVGQDGPKSPPRGHKRPQETTKSPQNHDFSWFWGPILIMFFVVFVHRISCDFEYTNHL